MRQAGIIAAAGIHALEQHVERLAEDHANAERLAEGLRALLGEAAEVSQATNMVLVRASDELMSDLSAELARHEIRFSARGRLVTHLDVSADDIRYVIERVERWLASR